MRLVPVALFADAPKRFLYSRLLYFDRVFYFSADILGMFIDLFVLPLISMSPVPKECLVQKLQSTFISLRCCQKRAKK